MKNLVYRLVSPIDKMLSGARGGTMLKPGDLAPAFTVKSHRGTDVSLSDFKGKNVILYFYPKADTPGCTAQGCGFRDKFVDYEKKNAVVLGVSFDTVAENAAFAKKFNFPFLLLCDTDHQIGMAYGAVKGKDDKYPARIGYVIDPAGRIKSAHPKVDAAAFPQTVINDI